MSTTTNPGNLKEVKGIENWAKSQYKTHYVYYRRKGNYAECHCSECGNRYVIRALPTEDPFQDAALDIEKPERDKTTKCRSCGTKAVYKPAGHTAPEYHFNRICYGQKIDNEHFVFRIFYSTQKTYADCKTSYYIAEVKRIFLEKGKKPIRYSCNQVYFYKDSVGEFWNYIVHPRTFANIKNTGMFKYVPVEEEITRHFWSKQWVMDYYIAAARYPDFEMILKMGLTEYANRLVMRYPTNINPRGKTIENRLRIYKNRIPDLIKAKGDQKSTSMFQLERRTGQHWTEEELKIYKTLRENNYDDKWTVTLKYMTLTKLKNYMIKQRMWPNPKNTWRTSSDKRNLRNEYYDYLIMRAEQGYDMTNEIILFPKDLRRRHNEMILEREKREQDKRKKEVLEKYPKIKQKYRRLSEKYSAAAGGYIIRPAKDAAEIVSEGRILHHCVGGDSYLRSHNAGNSFILFLRPVKEKDIPFITVEIRGEQIIQWYGAYDKKPNKKLFDAWLKKYTQELEKRKNENKTVKKSNKTVRKTNKSVQKTA